MMDSDSDSDTASNGSSPRRSAPRSLDGGTPEGMVRMEAKFGYRALAKDELSFDVGDLLTVLNSDKSGWWTAELNSKRGSIPGNYLRAVSSSPRVSFGKFETEKPSRGRSLTANLSKVKDEDLDDVLERFGGDVDAASAFLEASFA